MTASPGLLREALVRLADEIQPTGPPGIPAPTLRRIRLRRSRFVAIGVVAATVLSYGGFAGVRALTRAHRELPTNRITVPPAPLPSPCQPGAVDRFLPPSPHDEDILTGLAAFTGDDVWAVGEQFNGHSADPGGQLTLIEHWDGRAWNIIEGADTGPGNSALASISGTSSTDVWAVGRFAATNDPKTGPEAPLVEHWNGTRWTILPSPVPKTHERRSGIGLTGVVAVDLDDVWAVGYDWVLNTEVGASTQETLIEHWDGRSWKVVASPNLGDGTILQSVSAVSPTDVWAVGASYTGFGEISRSRPLVEHWDGREWSIVPSPTVRGLHPSLWAGDAVAAVASNDVWAAWRQLAFRWDGTTWARLPNVPSIRGLAARADGVVWAAGEQLARWDAGAWEVIPMNPTLPEGSAFTAVTLSENGDVWAVGGLGYPEGHQHPFAIRVCPA